MKISKNNYYCITLIIFLIIVLLVIAYSENIIKVVQENFDETPTLDRDPETYQLYENEGSKNFQTPAIYVRDDWEAPDGPSECLHIDVLKNNKALQGKWGDNNDEFIKFKNEKPSQVNPCTKCGPGSFLDSYKRSCTACPAGTYSDKNNSLKCKRCPPGKHTNNEGTSSLNECLDLNDYEIGEETDKSELVRQYNLLKTKFDDLGKDYQEQLDKQRSPSICESVTNQHEKQLTRMKEIKQTNDRIKTLRTQIDEYMTTLEDVKSIKADDVEDYYQDSSRSL